MCVGVGVLKFRCARVFRRRRGAALALPPSSTQPPPRFLLRLLQTFSNARASSTHSRGSATTHSTNTHFATRHLAATANARQDKTQRADGFGRHNKEVLSSCARARALPSLVAHTPRPWVVEHTEPLPTLPPPPPCNDGVAHDPHDPGEGAFLGRRLRSLATLLTRG